MPRLGSVRCGGAGGTCDRQVPRVDGLVGASQNDSSLAIDMYEGNPAGR
jgi:hypothetical protein